MHEDVPDKLIEQEQVRTYDKERVEVLIIDGVPDSDGDVFSVDCKVEFENPIPIVRKFGSAVIDNTIGAASLYREGNTVLADMFIQYSSPERLLIETDAKLYPSVAGRVLDKNGKVMKHIVVEAIMLTPERNSDRRIGHVTPVDEND